MAGKIHSSLWMLSSINKPSTFTFFSKTPHFRSSNNLFSLSSSSSSILTLCTCSTFENNDPFVLTTPLYYVNAPPHIGSAYTTIAADAIARFQRLLGKEVIFVTGTDELGEKIATSTAAAGSSPIEHCNSISQACKMLWKELDVAYDKFIRTTDPKHEIVVNEFYSRVVANGDIYRANYEGLYCANCEEYKDKTELDTDNCCSIHLKACIARKEDNYFFALSKYQKQLEDLLTQCPDFVQPTSRLNEVQGCVKTGLKDFSISRAAVDWGIQVPDDRNQTIYVWFDALLGYISALLENEEHPSLQSAVASGWPASLHLIGKFRQRTRTLFINHQASAICFSTISQTQFRQRTRTLFINHQASAICFSTISQTQGQKWANSDNLAKEFRNEFNLPVGQKITRKEKNDILIKTLLELGDSKDAIYGAMDAWVAWEQNFPIAALKHVLITLEKEHQWHRVVQVIKWMLSKGQGNTMGTYQQLIRALDMDHRAEEAHNLWVTKIGNDLHSVSWQACHLMISVYLRNNMFDRLVKLFQGLEAFDRKVPDKLIVQKVADAYESLNLEDDKGRLLEKYADLLNKTPKEPKECNNKSKQVKSRRKRIPSGSKNSLPSAIGT